MLQKREREFKKYNFFGGFYFLIFFLFIRTERAIIMNPDEVKIQSELLVEKWVCFLAWVFDIVMNDT